MSEQYRDSTSTGSYHTSRKVLVGPIDALALLPFVLLVFIHSWTLLCFAVFMAAGLWWLSYIGWSLPILYRALTSRWYKAATHRKKLFNKIVRY